MSSLDRYPENSETCLYISCGSYGNTIAIFDMIELIKDHFGEEISLDDLDITSENIHTRAIGYDLYDSSDYDNYIVITRK